MSITAPETQARGALKALLQAEFAAEAFPVVDDRLHESIGVNGTEIGTSPNRARPLPRNDAVLSMELTVQFYGHWDKEIDPQQRVDPAKIENYAERFRRALRTGDPRTNHVWYFRLVDLTYPDDPTGNRTRFEATVLALGQNPAVTETTG